MALTDPLFEVWEEVDELRRTKDDRTGLSTGGTSFFCSVDVPEHPHAHPHLLLPLEDID